MSSEALERAHAWLQQFIDAAREYGVSSENGRHAAALLAEVARLEQERDEREAGARWQYEMGKGWRRRALAAEAALAVARKREQRLDDAIREMLDLATWWSAPMDARERCERINAVGLAALVDEPAAATLVEPEARTRGGEEVPHERAASSVCGPQDASGSASAAADEPACRCTKYAADAACPEHGIGAFLRAAADEPGETP